MTAIVHEIVDDPASLGIDPQRLAELVERCRREVEEGLLPSCQVALARHGRLAAWATLGEAEPGSSYVIFSATKALVASAVWLLLGEGRLSLLRRVAEVIPEFGSNGKDVVTLEQVLLHTAGFPRAPLGPPQWSTREGRLAAFERWRLNWEPGTAFEYHATSAHWVLAEMIERVSGLDYRDFVRRRITEPLEVSGLRLGVPVDEQAEVAINTLVNVGEPPAPEEWASLGMPEPPVTEVTPEALLGLNLPEARALGVPGGGAISTAADLALFYQALLHNPGGFWNPEVLADGTANVRNMLPDWRGIAASRSIGLMIAGADGLSSLRGFGHTVSPRAFGHDGAGGQIAWADPATGLSFAYLTNGLDQHVLREWRRTSGIASRAAVCVD